MGKREQFAKTEWDYYVQICNMLHRQKYHTEHHIIETLKGPREVLKWKSDLDYLINQHSTIEKTIYNRFDRLKNVVDNLIVSCGRDDLLNKLLY